jgi:hypothetical protein
VPPRVQKACNAEALKEYSHGEAEHAATGIHITNVDCRNCLWSSKTDPSWGPLVVVQPRGPDGFQFTWPNVAGCVDLKGDHGCAQALEQRNACEAASCDIPRSGEPGTAVDQWFACMQKAATNGCKPYSDAVDEKCRTSSAFLACQYKTTRRSSAAAADHGNLTATRIRSASSGYR